MILKYSKCFRKHLVMKLYQGKLFLIGIGCLKKIIVEDDWWSVRWSTSNNYENVQKIKDLVLENRHVTVRKLSKHLGISQGLVKLILRNVLGLKRVAVKLIPKCLNFLQKQIRVEVAKEMFEQVNNNDTFVKRIITNDKTWVWQSDVLTKQQSSEWRSSDKPKPKKTCKFQTKIKVLLTVFTYYQGLVHHEFIPSGQTLNKEYYLK